MNNANVQLECSLDYQKVMQRSTVSTLLWGGSNIEGESGRVPIVTATLSKRSQKKKKKKTPLTTVAISTEQCTARAESVQGMRKPL